MTAPNLTLYQVETELMELLAFRESLFEDPEITPAERDETIKAIEKQIEEYVRAEVKKVDGIAHYLREFEARAAVYTNEIERLQKLKKVQDARYQRLSDLVLSIMIQTNQPKLEGRLSTFTLRKNPPSVDVVQPGLVPDNYQRLTVTMSPDTWNAVKKAVLRDEKYVTLAALLMECKVSAPEPEKKKIAEELKQTMPCEQCDGTGIESVPLELRSGAGYSPAKKCTACDGARIVNRGVPGCVLRTDRKRLEVK